MIHILSITGYTYSTAPRIITQSSIQNNSRILLFEVRKAALVRKSALSYFYLSSELLTYNVRTLKQSSLNNINSDQLHKREKWNRENGKYLEYIFTAWITGVSSTPGNMLQKTELPSPKTCCLINWWKK